VTWQVPGNPPCQTGLDNSGFSIMAFACTVCGSTELEIFALGGLRRGTCRACLHEQRIDIETFDYTGFAMGATGAGTARIADQAAFLARHVPPGARLLEIGCAAGLLARALRPVVATERYEGVELSPARAEATRHLDKVYDTSLPALQAQGIIPEQSYDMVISSHCLEHIADINTELAGIRTVLAHDGLLFVEVPNRSGNPGLPYDDNRAHLHFFSVSSLVRLLGRHSLDVKTLETGAWHDARYPDCIRAIARPARPRLATRYSLSEHPLLLGVDEVIVWGAGRMVDEILAHYFDPARIAFFVDKDERKHGTQCLGREVRPLDALHNYPGCTILINSLEYEDAIKVQIDSAFTDVQAKIIVMSDIIGAA
jgi:SAM-dependent methyltransferase